MNYQKIYDQIIERANNRKLTGYAEKHHILPKCLGGNDTKENLVKLTAREHFLCHRLLCEIYPNNPKLFYALWLMAIGKKKWKHTEPYKMSSKEYERLKFKFIQKSKTKIISDSHKLAVGKKNSRVVHQYDQNGILLKTYPSAIDAERSINNKPNEHWKKVQSNIDACCRLKQKSAYGFIWKYEGDILDLNEHIKWQNKQKK